jgi:hypothetical protein
VTGRQGRHHCLLLETPRIRKQEQRLKLYVLLVMGLRGTTLHDLLGFHEEMRIALTETELLAYYVNFEFPRSATRSQQMHTIPCKPTSGALLRRRTCNSTRAASSGEDIICSTKYKVHCHPSRFRFPPAALNADPRRLLRVLGLTVLFFLILKFPDLLPPEPLAR